MWWFFGLFLPLWITDAIDILNSGALRTSRFFRTLLINTQSNFNVASPAYFKCSGVIWYKSQALFFLSFLWTISFNFSRVIGGITKSSSLAISLIIIRSSLHRFKNPSLKFLPSFSLHKIWVLALNPSIYLVEEDVNR